MEAMHRRSWARRVVFLACLLGAPAAFAQDDVDMTFSPDDLTGGNEGGEGEGDTLSFDVIDTEGSPKRPSAPAGRRSISSGSSNDDHSSDGTGSRSRRSSAPTSTMR